MALAVLIFSEGFEYSLMQILNRGVEKNIANRKGGGVITNSCCQFQLRVYLLKFNGACQLIIQGCKYLTLSHSI